LFLNEDNTLADGFKFGVDSNNQLWIWAETVRKPIL